MPPHSICLFPELREIDPVLYEHLENLDIQANQSRGDAVSDGCLDPTDLDQLQRNGTLSPTHLAFYRQQFQYHRDTWDSLPSTVRGRWLTALRLARENEIEKARAEIEWARHQLGLTAPVHRFLEGQLLWLDVYTGDWESAKSKALSLLSVDPDNPLALYASATVANRSRNYLSAKSDVDHLQRLRAAPPYLLVESRELEEEVVDRSPTLTADLPEGTSPLSLTEQRSYLGRVAAQTLQDRPRLRALLSGVDPLDFGQVKKRLVSLTGDGTIPLSELPWLAHVYFHTFLRYVRSDEPRLLAGAVRAGIYDCTEYTEGMQEILRGVGIHSTAVAFNTTPTVKHSFLAYESGGKWGFASVMSFEPPDLSSLSEGPRRWRCELHSGPFLVGRMNGGVLEDMAIAPL